MSDISTYFIAAPDSGSALQVAWNERTAANPDNDALALHPDDVPAPWRQEHGHMFRVRVGVRWQDGRPVPVSEAEEVAL